MPTNAPPMSTALAAALALRDLTDPASGPHAAQLIVGALEAALAAAWHIPVRRDAGSRVVSVADNYDRLRYPADAVTRDRRYTHYLGDGRMLRSHATARIPALLADIATGRAGADGEGTGSDTGRTVDAVRSDVLLSVPGICYRRDVIDRHHVGQPHQLDLWLIRPAGPPLTTRDLATMIGVVVEAVLPGRPWHTPPSPHPYTVHGREIYVRDPSGTDVEIGECGLAHPEVLADAGLPASCSGLAMGLGVDRLVMLVKGVPDIRLLRVEDQRVADQMRDLAPYRPVSAMPPTRRDLSLAVSADLDDELLGDRVRELLGDDADTVEEIEVRGRTGYDQLPQSARDRMGIRPGQQNLLVRVVLRHPTRTLTAEAANALRDRVYAGLHEGTRQEWAAGRAS